LGTGERQNILANIVRRGAKSIGAVRMTAIGLSVRENDKYSPVRPHRATMIHSLRAGSSEVVTFARIATTKPSGLGSSRGSEIIAVIAVIDAGGA